MFYEQLETARLILRNISENDRDFVYNQFSNDLVNEYLFDAEPLTSIHEADEIINYYIHPEPRPQHRWVLVSKQDNMKLGTCGFHNWDPDQGIVEVGYDLNEAHWGMGFMTEALNAIIKFAFRKMQVKEINACIYFENSKSIKLVEKLGFRETGTRQELFRGKEYLHNIYTLKQSV